VPAHEEPDQPRAGADEPRRARVAQAPPVRRCYECAHRMDDLVTVAAFPDASEAELARERLELEGIAAFVIGAQTAGVMPFLTGPTGGVRVQVAPRDVERAREVLGA
jgi:hypothetical protein